MYSMRDTGVYRTAWCSALGLMVLMAYQVLPQLAAAGRDVSAQPQFFPASAEMMERGVVGYVGVRDGSKFYIEIIADRDSAAHLEGTSAGGWTSVSISMYGSGESLEMLVDEASKGDRGFFLRDGAVVASWDMAKDGSAKQVGVAELLGSPAFEGLVRTLDEAGAQQVCWPCGLIPILPLVLWICLQRCNCCEAFYAPPGPPPGAPEPSCCSHCFSAACFDFF